MACMHSVNASVEFSGIDLRRFMVNALGEMWREPGSRRGASVAGATALPGRIARERGAVETALTTTFRGPSAIASSKASGGPVQHPSHEEKKMEGEQANGAP